MSAVSETIVREYFELHEFLVRQHRKYIGLARDQDEDDIDFFVLNPHPQPCEGGLPFVLGSADLAFLERAIVVVKGWHTQVFSPSQLTHSPEIFRFVEPRVFQQAARAFGKQGTPLKILVVPALPHDAQARDESIALLRSKGIDAVLPFRTMLTDLVKNTENLPPIFAKERFAARQNNPVCTTGFCILRKVLNVPQCQRSAIGRGRGTCIAIVAA